MWLQTLGTRTLALPILQEQARALQAVAGISLVPALSPGCSLGIAMGGGQQGFQGITNNKAALAERNERLGGEKELAGGFTLSSRMEEKCSHSLLAAPA